MKPACEATIRQAEAMRLKAKPQWKSTGQRFSLNMISAISNKGHLQFMLIEKFNGDVFIDFCNE
ncbi:MAG: hypothetical protein IPH58_19630 [Sphingobacteriales bacterium]|nr:hypothetical protein [Sphingobacteriales bacterium]